MRSLVSWAVAGAIAVVVVMGIISGTSTTGWNETVATLFPYIGLGLIAAVVIAMFTGIGKRGGG